MKVCFIGLGSIASRHIKHLNSIFVENQLSIDVLRSGKGKTTNEEIKHLLHCEYYKLEALPNDYDVIFITNPTKLHYETLIKVHDLSKHFFIEKPVFETGKEKLDELKLRKNSIYYVACPLRYSAVIRHLKKHIDFTQIYSIRCISSSYLPDWRPGTDYRNSYSAKKELGGGVSIDLIHEWDYVQYLIGEPVSVKSYICKKSDLEIDSDDIAVYIAEYSNKIVEIHLDYFGKIPVRKIELFGKDDVIEADLINSTITFKKKSEVIKLYDDRDSYQKEELKHFFRIIALEQSNDNTIAQAYRTLQITKGE